MLKLVSENLEYVVSVVNKNLIKFMMEDLKYTSETYKTFHKFKEKDQHTYDSKVVELWQRGMCIIAFRLLKKMKIMKDLVQTLKIYEHVSQIKKKL
jgi:hypothetical protein